MFTATPDQILLCVFAVLAGAGVGMYFVLKRRKWVVIRKRAFVVSAAAQEQGFLLLAEIAESIATGDIVELFKELEYLEKMAATPGALMVHLNKLFTVQLTKRLADPALAKEIFDAVDAARAATELARKKIVEEAKAAEAAAK